MKQFCVDTSGISTPLERMPDDIYQPLWDRVIEVLASGVVAVTTEIYDEMYGSLMGVVGSFIDDNRGLLLLEIGADGWDSAAYVRYLVELQTRHHDVIAEYNNDRRRTVGLNDISIIALAKTLQVPLVSMEQPAGTDARDRRKIPDICRIESIEHIDFNEFIRQSGISLRER